MSFDFTFDRTVVIRARRATVFRFFLDSERFARWWGPGSTIDPRVGGAVRIRYPNGELAEGEITELVPDTRIAFTFGYPDPKKPIPVGGSLVSITLEEVADGTRLTMKHHVATAEVRELHGQGWKYQFAVFAKVVADDEFAGIERTIAAWFTAWNEPDAARCSELLRPLVASQMEFRDGFACVSGVDELLSHIAACQQFMPGIRVESRGATRGAHATFLADFEMVKVDGTSLGRGTNVFRFAPGGMIIDVVGVAG
jgi:uncharacterized protein YndB with AHSA1/START domain